MDIRRIPITDINPAPYNPRLDLKPGDSEYKRLAKSIAEFDCVEPLVWNKRTGNLVGGHQRLKILKERGDETVEVSAIDLDEPKEKALNLALNKISGDWDFSKLSDLLEELCTGDFDMETTGFGQVELDDLILAGKISLAESEYAGLIQPGVERETEERSDEIRRITLTASTEILTDELAHTIRELYFPLGIKVEID